MSTSAEASVNILGVGVSDLDGAVERSVALIDGRSQGYVCITGEADVLSVGLSTPKQERFMAERQQLPVKLMVGVGAAFDLLSGNLSEAPDWMKRIGMQWFYRLVKEPRRLWKRYLRNNPLFLFLITLQLTKLKTYDLGA